MSTLEQESNTENNNLLSEITETLPLNDTTNNTTNDTTNTNIEPETITETQPLNIETDIPVITTNETIIKFEEILLGDGNIESENIHLDQSIKNILLAIIKSNSTLLYEIQTTLNKIMSLDNKVNISDLPELLILNKKLIEVIHNLSNTTTTKINKTDIPEISSKLLKYIVRMYIKEKLITVFDNDDFLINFDKLVDSVGELVVLFGTLKTPCCRMNWKIKFFN